MTIAIRIAISSILLIFALTAVAQTTEVSKKYFKIRIPLGFEIQETAAVESDIFYTVSHGDKSYLQIYVGNAPRFPQLADGMDQSVSVLRTREATIISKWNNNQIVDLEILVVRVAGLDWPKFVHAWTAAPRPRRPTNRFHYKCCYRSRSTLRRTFGASISFGSSRSWR
jgi:hypothetical protein